MPVRSLLSSGLPGPVNSSGRCQTGFYITEIRQIFMFVHLESLFIVNIEDKNFVSIFSTFQ